MSEAAAPASPLRLGLVGSPNSGKTTLFNALTGLRAKVGNYPGVTVERREGRMRFDGRRIVIVDLPGTYSLSPVSADEAVVRDVLTGGVDGVERSRTLDLLGFKRQLVFSTFATAFIRSDDVGLMYAATRAHSKAMVDFCGNDSRLMPVALVPLDHPERAIAELREDP